MRLAVCALSAVLLSGCSWLGIGGQNAGFSQSGGAYGVNCAPGGFNYGGAYGADACGVGGGYGVAGAGYGAGGYGCLLYTSPSPRDQRGSRMPSSA